MFAIAQEFGAIRGTVSDQDGNPLPGVSVTLAGVKVGTRTAVTSERGNFRFLNLPVANDYEIKIELPGFRTVTRTELDVSYGRDIVLDLVMEQSAIEETITVVGQTPVIDTKKTQVGVNITDEMIMSLPTARNPWVLMALVPGMLINKEDVGGNEAGQQSDYSGHGSLGRDNTWNIDGANVTDNSALGAAPAYFNIASYEEMQVNYGNNDVKSQTGGVQINLVTRRGGNKFSGMFYLDLEDKKWQSSNVSDELKGYGYANPGVDRINFYGANFGGPIVKDKAWFYGSWGIQDINAINLSGTVDNTLLNSAYAKLNFQVTKNTRAEFFLGYDNKIKTGRLWFDATESSPESVWDQDGPGYQWKAEIEQMAGNLYLDAKFLYLDNSFFLHPREQAEGMPMTLSYYPEFYVTGSLDDYGTTRKNYNGVLTGNYFAEEILGGDHEIKFGVDVMTSTVNSYDYYEGNAYRYYYGPDETMPNGEYWEIDVRRDVNINYWMRRFSFFVQDTATYGRLTINLGLRYDNETSQVKDQAVPASPFLPDLLPALEITKLDPGISWAVFSPRINFIYDLRGNGKDVLKLSLARYGSQEGFGMADFLNPMGWSGIGVVWQDDGDGIVTNDELWGFDGDGNLAAPTADTILWAWGTNVDNPTDITPANRIDPKFNSVLLDELTFSYEKEIITDFAARLEFFYKKSHRNIWDRAMDLDGTLEERSNYYDAGTEPETGQTIWGSIDDYYYEYRTNYKNRYSKYLAGQIVLTKRLSKRWMLDTSFTLSDWKYYYKDEYIDPHNVSYYDKAVSSSMNSTWQFKFSGLYQLPFGVNLSAVFRAREGYVRDTYVREYRPNIGTQSFYDGPRGDNRLPTFYELDFRLEKVFTLSTTSRVVFAVDAFNALNSAHVLAQQNLITSDIFNRTTQILNPRVFRFGIRFEF